jgi:hypothetical protein
MGLGLGAMNQAAALAQRNQAMDVLERERGGRGMTSLPGAVVSNFVLNDHISTSQPANQRPPEEDDSGGKSASRTGSVRCDLNFPTDEYENVSTRTLAIERFKRNHELMAEVFTYASKGGLRIFPLAFDLTESISRA